MFRSLHMPKPPAPRLVKVVVPISQEALAEIDAAWKRRGLPNRAAGVRDMFKRGLATVAAEEARKTDGR
jgi:metal-responsive CopG/Arc/MetJ family transcriptional regulator